MSQFFTIGQGFLIDVKGSLMVFNVLDLNLKVDIKKTKKNTSLSCGMLTESTIITLEIATGSTLKLIEQDDKVHAGIECVTGLEQVVVV